MLLELTNSSMITYRKLLMNPLNHQLKTVRFSKVPSQNNRTMQQK